MSGHDSRSNDSRHDDTIRLDRRRVLKQGVGLGVSMGVGVLAPSLVGRGAAYAFDRAPAFGRQRVAMPCGVQAGDLKNDRAMIWSCADRPARMIVEIDTTPAFYNPRRLRGPAALPDSDFTAKLDVGGLPADQTVFYRVYFEDLANARITSHRVVGRFNTLPSQTRDVRFLWSGDVAGQGWGINPDIGGMTIFEAMRRTQPDFFIHNGDTVYADDPIPATQTTHDGQIWNNLTTPGKDHVADSLADFHAAQAYNFQDDNMRRFYAEVPKLAQWDDHEVYNNWSPGEVLPDNDPHATKSANLLAARGMRAFEDYMPVRPVDGNRDKIYNRFPYGPTLEVFRLDMRSYRATNNRNRQPAPGPDTAYLGAEQLAWLKRSLADSTATWKIIAADMPLGLIVTDQTEPYTTYENSSNGDGPVLGREFEIASLLRFIKAAGVRNTVWLTTDVHYTAAHYYDPNKARFQDFDPFWEFVSGPLNAGTFGPNPLDNTFGPQVVFQKVPSEGQANLSPLAGMQFFGQIDIDAYTQHLSVSLKDLQGHTLHRQVLAPERA